MFCTTINKKLTSEQREADRDGGFNICPDGELFAYKNFYYLKVCNCMAGLLHLASFIALIVVAAVFNFFEGPEYRIAVTSTKATGGPFDAIEMEQLGKVPIVIFPVMFSAICFIAHFLVELDYYGYICGLKKQTLYFNRILDNRNTLRWVEYFFSSTIMVVAIGLIVGVTDLQAILANSGVNMAMIWCGFLHERSNARILPAKSKRGLYYYAFGVFFGIIPWIGILRLGFTSALNIPDASVRFLVLNIVFTLFALFFVFAWPPIYLWYKQRKQSITIEKETLKKREIDIDEHYRCYELSYIALSFTAKTLLTWLIFGVLFAI
jgi:hypothetical protein